MAQPLEDPRWEEICLSPLIVLQQEKRSTWLSIDPEQLRTSTHISVSAGFKPEIKRLK